jgi:hypothetical protein
VHRSDAEAGHPFQKISLYLDPAGGIVQCGGTLCVGIGREVPYICIKLP